MTVTTPILQSSQRLVVEWPTLALAALIYSGWALATLFHRFFSPFLLAVVGGWLIAWYGSLQHEIIHDHPTPWRRVNTVLGMAPLSLWLPFELYRRSHIVHHVTEHLTEPALDPESYYLTSGASPGGPLGRAVGRLQACLLARLLLGPIIGVSLFLTGEVGRIARCDKSRLHIWAIHGLLVAAVLAWLHFVCNMSLGLYLLCFVYPGRALSLVRSYAEHRAHPDPLRRTAAVEHAPVLGLLYLYNNLHVAHHYRPNVPWYQLPGLYRREREHLLDSNGGLVYDGYIEIFRRFLLRPHDQLIHADAIRDRQADAAEALRRAAPAVPDLPGTNEQAVGSLSGSPQGQAHSARA